MNRPSDGSIQAGSVPAPAIAVIGMSCRVPGARSVEEFWSLLCDGVDATDEIPVERFDARELYDPEPGTPGKLVTRRGGFLDNIDQFDAEFFGISPREAESMDPQQRLLLECSWEALEDAGQPVHALSGSRTGVFVGASASNYWDLAVSTGEPDVYATTGSGARSALSGRISFALDLHGPSLTLDTACSSSLVALNLACQSLQSGETTMALVGGTNLILTPTETIAYSQGGMLSPDGHCRFGDAAADGFVRSEAVAVVVLKPLAQAVADGDPVHAVIRGWATVSDGAGSGSLMAPSPAAQRQTLRDAYSVAGLEPATVAYVEAHGTGTQVGDPVELEALGTVLAAGRPPERPLLVGSAKTNIGHTEAAAGLIGLIKAVCCLKHRAVPASLHFTEPNPSIPWQHLPMAIPQFTQPLEPTGDGHPLVVGVSAFGISGTNAHIVLTEPDATQDPGTRHTDAAVDETGPEHVLPLSARNPAALDDLLRFYLAHLSSVGRGQDQSFADLCHSAATRRTHHPYRLAVTATDHSEAATAFRDLLHSGRRDDGLSTARSPRVAFVFPGQGSQWVGMGRELLAASPAFRQALHRCAEAIHAEAGWSLLDKLQDNETTWDQIDRVQPALWAIEVALAETWKAWGLRPDVLIGHSMGEVAAACVAGALDLRAGAAVICRRSALVLNAAGKGAMAVVELSAADAADVIRGYADRVSVAASSSHRSTVLSGDPDSLTEIMADLERRAVFCRLIRVDFASHSPQMDPLLDQLIENLGDLEPSPGDIPIRSTVTTEILDGSGMDAHYWAANLRRPVRFQEAVEATAAEADTVFVEISPHPLLLTAIEDTLAERGHSSSAVASLRREQPERATLLSNVAQVYRLGGDVDWSALYRGGRYVTLPHYPWQRQRYWLDSPQAVPVTGLGASVDLSEHVVHVTLDSQREPFLGQHRVNGTSLTPGTVFTEAIRSSLAGITGQNAMTVQQLRFLQPLLLTPGESAILAVALTPGVDGTFDVAIGGDDGCYCEGRAQPVPALPAGGPPTEAPEAIMRRCPKVWDADTFYRLAEAGGSTWGPSFHAIQQLWCGDGEALARLQTPPRLETNGYPIHPALLEASAQPLLALLPHPASILASGMGQAQLLRPAGTAVWSHVRLGAADDDGHRSADVVVFDQEGVIATMNDLDLTVVNPTNSARPAINGATERDTQTNEISVNPNGVPAAISEIEVTGGLTIRDAQQRVVLKLAGSLTINPHDVANTTAHPTPAAASAPPTLLPTAPAAVTSSELTPRRRKTGLSAPTASTSPPDLQATPPRASSGQPRDRPHGALFSAVGSGEPPATPEELRDYLHTKVAATLHTSRDRVDPDRPLTEFGLDSLMAQQVRNHVRRDLGVAMPANRLLRGSTIGDAVTALIELLSEPPVASRSAPS